MKIRIASSLALAAGLVLGVSGCNLIAPQATLEQYAPSDGVEARFDGVDLLNVLLVADETGEGFNVVFNSVNTTGSPVDLAVQLDNGSGQNASVNVTLPAGSAAFGDPAQGQEAVVAQLPGTVVGSTVDAAFQIAGLDEVQTAVPVLDGTLAEYAPLVLPAPVAEEPEADEEVSEETDAE